MSDKEPETVTKVKYLGHIIRDDLSDDDDDDLQRQRYKLDALMMSKQLLLEPPALSTSRV